MHNEARATVEQGGGPVWVATAILAGIGVACLAAVHQQGAIYTREAQLARERIQYQQDQIAEMRTKQDRLEAKLILAESRIQRLMEPKK